MKEGRAEQIGVSRCEGCLVRSAQEMAVQDVGVRRRDEGVLVRAAKEEVRVAHQVLIQRIVPGHQDAQRGLLSSTAPSDLLPGAADAAGVAGQNGRVQIADIEAQLQGVGGGHPQQLTAEQGTLDLPTLLGEVASPVRTDPVHQLGSGLCELVADGHVHQLNLPSCSREGERPYALFKKAAEQLRALGYRALASRFGLINQRGIPEQEFLAAKG